MNYQEFDKQDRSFCDRFIDKTINNKKGLTADERFVDVLSDPNNLLIERIPEAGQVSNGNIILHNGILVSARGYYGEFSKILELNKGVHEPSEERMFMEVLKYIPENGVMIELGSYWAYYSIWFNWSIKNAKNYCIEPSNNSLKIGINNCKLNNVEADFTQAFIGKGKLNLKKFITQKGISYIDILHSDIQGHELEMLNDITDLLDQQKIRYLFISTHSNNLHHACINLLKKHDYRIIAAADFDNETFCFDGIIVACHKDNLDISYTSLGCRKHTLLRKDGF